MMTLWPLVRKIDDLVSSYMNSETAVALSGGLDSASMLFHLTRNQGRGPTKAITLCFGDPEDNPTLEHSKRIADHFRVAQHIIVVETEFFLAEMERLQHKFREPRYNIWPIFLTRKARELGSQLFTGEGSDEIFGYPDRGYLEGWAGQLCYVDPAWQVCGHDQGVEVIAPYLRLAAPKAPGLPRLQELFEPPDKRLQRELYQGLLPGWILNTPSQPPSNPFYAMMAKSWGMNFTPGFTLFDEVRQRLMVLTCNAWVKAHEGKEAS